MNGWPLFWKYGPKTRLINCVEPYTDNVDERPDVRPRRRGMNGMFRRLKPLPAKFYHKGEPLLFEEALK